MSKPNSIDERLRQVVWDKGRVLPDRDPTLWRQDQCGAWMHRDQFENADSDYGWCVVNTVAGGGDRPEDLQPMHQANEYDIANGRPHCRTTAERSGLAPGQSVDQPRNGSV